MRIATRAGRRTAFTLIELLVVIGLIIVLATLAVMIVPNLNEKRAAARGADQLQGWLLIAKQRALRDQAPRGLRLIPDVANGNPTLVKELQYIEVPENYVPPPGSTLTVSGNQAQVSIDINGAVQVGEWVEITSLAPPSIHRITGMSPPGAPTTLSLASPELAAAGGPFTTSSFRFVRAARPLLGETTLQLPSQIVIDLNLSLPNPWPMPNGYIDVLFAPSGQVVGASQGRFVLWVRHIDNIGEPTLMTVYTRTGQTAAHPPDALSGNPYSYTQDGMSSGL